MDEIEHENAGVLADIREHCGPECLLMDAARCAVSMRWPYLRLDAARRRLDRMSGHCYLGNSIVLERRTSGIFVHITLLTDVL